MRYWLIIAALLSSLLLSWLGNTNHPQVWPVRNTLQYHFLKGWWSMNGPPQDGNSGILTGQAHDSEGAPVPGTRVLVSLWDGTTFSTWSDEAGRYTIEGIPAGQYKPVAGAPGYESRPVGAHWGGVMVTEDAETVANVELEPTARRELPPGTDLRVGEPVPLDCTSPIESRAARRPITFRSLGAPNQMTFLYMPITESPTSPLPTLLTVYPGPADSWDCASIPLAAAGYAVLAVSPTYSLTIERDIDELEQLVGFVRAGQIPGADGERLAVLGGSYSALLTQRLLQRDKNFDATVLLGAPTDLFDIRRRFEREGFLPPFGLDQALIALGFPDREPMRYWQYSSAYHVDGSLPPTAIFHSYNDDIVPYQQSELLADALTRVGVTHELHLFDGATHYLLAEDSDALEIYRLTLDFLERYLQEPESHTIPVDFPS